MAAPKKPTKQKKSVLAKQAEKLFSQQVAPLPPYEPAPAYPAYFGELRVVQTVTTYSACEEPIPNVYNKH